MNNVVYEDKFVGAFLAAAIGDALGWPNEQNSKNIKPQKNSSDFFVKWTRKCGGRYYTHEEIVNPGEYSDDTQMIIATARSLLCGPKWNAQFIKNELPYWLEYERGGGAALKLSAKCWKEGKPPWHFENSKETVKKYFNAGGNGVAMRILPHVIVNIDKPVEKFMEDVLRNGMYTHGHPRALIGAAAYAYALWILANKSTKLEYGQLIDEVIKGDAVWGEFYNVINSEEWLHVAKDNLGEEYSVVWDNTVKLLINKLFLAKKSILMGALDLGNNTLDEIGCFDKKINGAGDVTSVAAIYLASKYAANPIMGIREAAFLNNADTDTLASMVGGLLGMLHGTEWIPNEWELVQDYELLKTLPVALYKTYCASEFVIEPYNKKAPIGEVEIIDSYKYNAIISNIEVNIVKTVTLQGQTLYFKKCRRIRKDDASKHIDATSFNLNRIIEFKINQEQYKEINKSNIKKVTFGKVLDIVIELKNNQFTDEQIAKKLNTKIEYVRLLEKMAKNEESF